MQFPSPGNEMGAAHSGPASTPPPLTAMKMKGLAKPLVIIMVILLDQKCAFLNMNFAQCIVFQVRNIVLRLSIIMVILWDQKCAFLNMNFAQRIVFQVKSIVLRL